MCRVEQRQLFLTMSVVRIGFEFFLEPFPNTLPHFRRRGIGKRNHQQFIDGRDRILPQQAMQTALDQRTRLSRPRTSDQQHIAASGKRLLLGGG